MSHDQTESFTSALDAVGQQHVPCLVLQAQHSSPFVRARMVGLTGAVEVTLARGKDAVTRTHWKRAEGTIELSDRWMSSPHARLAQKSGRWTLYDLKSKNGVYLNGARIQTADVEDGDLIEVGSTFLLFRTRVPSVFVDEITARESRGDPVESYSAAVQAGLDDLDRIAATGLSVLLSGETGTGKELAAKRVHVRSGRSGPFLPINCAAIAGSLAESELFGSMKGSFSGASEDRAGLIRASHGGTLFLDEVGDLESSLQAKLLRAIQEREVLPIGGQHAVPVDLRVVSASFHDLNELVESGQFRQDLRARLAGFSLELLPLRDRREDVGPLLTQLLSELLEERAEQVVFDRESLRAILLYDWPANVRQLKQALEQSAALAPNLQITLKQLPAELQEPEPSRLEATGGAGADEALRQRLTQSLRDHRGNVSAVARELGKERVQIRRWCRRFALDPESFREPRG